MKKLTIVATVTIVSIVWLSCLYTAYADEYKTLGIQHKGIPLTWIFEPHPVITEQSDEIIQAAEVAVKNWNTTLNTHSPNGVWSLPTTVIPIESHHLKDPYEFPQCNILISFEYAHAEKSLGYTGISFHKSIHKFTHAVIFLNAFEIDSKVNIILGNGGDVEIKRKIVLNELSTPVIQNIITHEFGHGLGLGHYKITDYPIYTADKPWVEASIMYYALNPYDDTLAFPQYVDVKMLEEIYSDDGFGGTPVTKIPKIGYYSPGDVNICTFKCNINR